MDTDFLDAHDRHWEDAEFLLADARLANADHLYGLAAECGLKRLMQAFGMELSSSGMPRRNRDIVHADRIWNRYEAYRSGYGAADYLLPKENVFGDWNIAERYTRRDRYSMDKVDAHRQGADAVRALVGKARRDGLL